MAINKELTVTTSTTETQSIPNHPSTLTAAGKEAAIPPYGVAGNNTGTQSLSAAAREGLATNLQPVDPSKPGIYKNIPKNAPDNIQQAIPRAEKSYNKNANSTLNEYTKKLQNIIASLPNSTAKNPGKIGDFDAWVEDDKIYLNANKDANTDIKIYIDKTGIHCSETLTQASINRLKDLQDTLRTEFKKGSNGKELTAEAQTDIDKVLDFNIDGLQAIYNAYMDGSFSANQIELFKTNSEPKYLVMSFDDKELELKTISTDKTKTDSCKIDAGRSTIKLEDIFKDSQVKDYQTLVKSAISAQIEKSKNIPFVRSHTTQDTRETASENANTLWQHINKYIFEKSENSFPRVTQGMTTKEAKNEPVTPFETKPTGEGSIKPAVEKEKVINVPLTESKNKSDAKDKCVFPWEDEILGKAVKESFSEGKQVTDATQKEPKPYSVGDEEKLNQNLQELFQEQQIQAQQANANGQEQAAQKLRPQQPLSAPETQQTNPVQNEIQTQTKPKGELDEVLKAFNELKLNDDQKDSLKKMISKHLINGGTFNTAFPNQGNTYLPKQTFESSIKKKINTILFDLRDTKIFNETEIQDVRSFLEHHLNIEKLTIVESDSEQTKQNYTALINAFGKDLNLPSSK